MRPLIDEQSVAKIEEHVADAPEKGGTLLVGGKRSNLGGTFLEPTAMMGWPPWTCDVDGYPVDWLGDHEHTYRAINDAEGYAHLLVTLMSKSSPA